MEGKTNFPRRLKQFDGLTGLTPIPLILGQIYVIAFSDTLTILINTHCLSLVSVCTGLTCAEAFCMSK